VVYPVERSQLGSWTSGKFAASFCWRSAITIWLRKIWKNAGTCEETLSFSERRQRVNPSPVGLLWGVCLASHLPSHLVDVFRKKSFWKLASLFAESLSATSESKIKQNFPDYQTGDLLLVLLFYHEISMALIPLKRCNTFAKLITISCYLKLNSIFFTCKG